MRRQPNSGEVARFTSASRPFHPLRRVPIILYRIITDRYALPQGADPTKCDPADQTWCGGTWNTIRENLDYVQEAGFTASEFQQNPSVFGRGLTLPTPVWISPVSQNYQGPRSAYGDAYHGYWIADATQLNDRFGTADDLKALSDEVHRRGMYVLNPPIATTRDLPLRLRYLMVDVVVNNVMSTSLTPDWSQYMFKDAVCDSWIDSCSKLY